MSLFGSFIRSVTERNARGESYADFQRALTMTGETVPHNQVGDLTIGGWLSYMITHAGRESRRPQI